MKFRILLASLILGVATASAQAREKTLFQLPDTLETQEGLDRQSDAEIEAARIRIDREFANVRKAAPLTKSQEMEVLGKYDHLDPNRVVPTKLLKDAVLFFDLNLSSFPNKNYIAVVDFKKRSSKVRFFLINMTTGAVRTLHVAHGKGSDPDNDGYATLFSNLPGSHKSSIGFYRVAEVYSGARGRSVRLDGLSSTNSNVRSRAIVIHGSDYVQEAAVIQGRSLGCFAFDWDVKDDVINKLRDGALMYANLSN